MTKSVDTSSDHKHVILSCSSGTLYTAYGRYTDNKVQSVCDWINSKTFLKANQGIKNTQLQFNLRPIKNQSFIPSLQLYVACKTTGAKCLG